MRLVTVLLVLLICASLASAFSLPTPSIPSPIPIPTPSLDLGIPGLNLVRSEGPWITTGLGDAVTEVPFLDHYDPRVLAPLAEMPCSPTGQFTLLPGAYDFYAQSYCLHAGAYAPGAHGNGYLNAPLKGPGATFITHILQNSVSHPEVDQHNIQLLIWALLARTPVNQLNPTLQQTAHTLLSDGEIRSLTPDPLIPDALMNQSFVNLPPAVQRALELEANLRNMFANKVADYTQIEGVAVLTGDPPPSKDDRLVPAARWSYRTDGYFVAYVPYGYPRTETQISCPAGLTVERDAAGRLVSITGPRGDKIITEYAADAPGALPGDKGVQVCPFRAIHLSAPDRLHAAGTVTFDLEGAGYTLMGLPSGKGKPVASSVAANLPDRYAWSVAHRQQVEKLLAQAAPPPPTKTPPAVRNAVTGQLVDLGNYAQALWEVLSAARAQNPQVDLLLANPAYEAWQALVIQFGQGQVAPPAPTNAQSWGTLPAFGLGLGFASGTPAAFATLTSAVYGAWTIPQYNPAGNAAQPGNTGSQRLAQSSRGANGDPPTNRNGSTPAYQESYANKDILKRGKDAMDLWAKAMALGDILTGGPVLWIAGQIGGYADPRGMLLGGGIDTIFSMAGDIGKAMGGDPPRSDYDQVATPQAVAFPPYAPGGDVSAAKVQAVNDMLAAAADLWSKLRAGQITRDRLGGAYLTGSQADIDRQGQALIDLKRQCGLAMLVLANRMEALVAITPVDQMVLNVSAADLQTKQAALGANGFGPAKLAAMQFLGLTAAELEAQRQQELALTAPQAPTNLLPAAQAYIAALREWGRMWSSPPPVQQMGGV